MQFLGYAVSLCSVVGDTRLVGVVTKSSALETKGAVCAHWESS